MINAHLGTGILYHCGLYPTDFVLVINHIATGMHIPVNWMA